MACTRTIDRIATDVLHDPFHEVTAMIQAIAAIVVEMAGEIEDLKDEVNELTQKLAEKETHE